MRNLLKQNNWSAKSKNFKNESFLPAQKPQMRAIVYLNYFKRKLAYWMHLDVNNTRGFGVQREECAHMGLLLFKFS